MAKTLTGVVTSDVADKTITVAVISRETHMRRTTRITMLIRATRCGLSRLAPFQSVRASRSTVLKSAQSEALS